MWDFETDPKLQRQLDWIDEFVREQLEPLDYVLPDPLDMESEKRNRLIKPLQAEVKKQNLWAFHLGAELGGPGLGQVQLALMNEKLGRSICAPVVFGCHAPDAGNAEILAHYGTEEQKQRYLKPLLANDITSCFAMTEAHGGSDPLRIESHAVLRDGNWIINGEKWFATNARYAAFYILLAKTNPQADKHKQMSVFIIPADSPGIEIIRNMGVANEAGQAAHGYVRFQDVRVPEDHLLGEPGEGFVVTQVRLGGGRVHHAMRTLAQCRMAFDMMCERALSRETQGEALANKQLIQDMIAESWMQLEQYRLFLLRTAWRMDKYKDYKKVRKDISAIKVLMPKVLQDIASRAVQIHGSLGITNEMPFVNQTITAMRMGIADGPTEVHKITVAKQVLRDYQASDDLFPSGHRLKQRQAAQEKFKHILNEPDDDPGSPP